MFDTAELGQSIPKAEFRKRELELRASLGTTFVVVTHELASIFAIGTDSVFLDAESKTMIAQGNPNLLLEESDDPRVRDFLTRGG